MGREGCRILGYNKDGEEQWFEGGSLPEHWYKQDPTKAKVDPKGTEYPDVKDDGPQDEPEVETVTITEDEMPKDLPMGAVEEVIERGSITPEAEPKPDPAPVEKPKAKAKKKVELDEDGDEPMPETSAPVETEKRKPGRPKKGD